MHINREALKQLHTEQEETAEVVSEEPSKNLPKKSFVKRNSKEAGKYIGVAIVIVLILIASVYKIIMDNPYHPQGQAEEIDVSSLNISSTDNMLVIRNPKLGETKHKIGIIFYQDVRVEAECYLPLMTKLANLGYDCFLSKSFGNQTFLNVDGADTIIRKYTSIKTWVIAAHASGCDPAAKYILDNSSKVDGLICLGGYTKKNLSGLGLSELFILGSLDSLVNQKAFQNAKKNAPENAVYQTIEGGNNSCFADTKLQDHDTKATISFDRQTDITRDLIHEFLQEQLGES